LPVTTGVPLRPTPGSFHPRPTRRVDNFPNPPASGLHKQPILCFCIPPPLFRSRFIQLPLERLRAIPITAHTSRRLTEGNQLLIRHLTQAFAQLLQLLFVGLKRDGISLSVEEVASYYQGRRMVRLFGTLCVKDSVLQAADGMPLSLVFG
jgi:hypothetical protein